MSWKESRTPYVDNSHGICDRLIEGPVFRSGGGLCEACKIAQVMDGEATTENEYLLLPGTNTYQTVAISLLRTNSPESLDSLPNLPFPRGIKTAVHGDLYYRYVREFFSEHDHERNKYSMVETWIWTANSTSITSSAFFDRGCASTESCL